MGLLPQPQENLVGCGIPEQPPRKGPGIKTMEHPALPNSYSSAMVTHKSMKLLVSGSDTAKIELVRTKLLATHIRCEIRRELATGKPDGLPSYPELWVIQDKDFHVASRIFTRYGAIQPSLRSRIRRRPA